MPATTASSPALSTTTRTTATPRTFYATGWWRAMYLSGAAATFGLAILGAVLPGLPTTPFLLLTSYCLVRTSPTLHRRLLASPVFGTLLRDWQKHRGVRPGVKTKSIVFMLLVVGASLAWGSLPPLAMMAVATLAMIGVAVVMGLKVIDVDE